MKRWALPAVLAFAAAGVFAPTRATPAAEPVTFAIKFPPGQIDHQTVLMEMDQTISGDFLPTPEKMKMKMSVKMTLKQIKSDATGSTVELVHDSLKMSGSLLPQATSDQLDKMLVAIVGQKITLHFTPSGKVDQVSGVDAIVAKLPPGASQTAIKQFLSDERIKDQFNSVFEQMLPAKPVSVGDTWETEITYKVSDVEVKLNSQVKLLGIDERDGHKIARLQFTGNGKLELIGAAGAPKFDVDQFNRSGSAEFDLTRGWIMSQNVDQHLLGKVKFNVGGKPASMKIDQTVKAAATMFSSKPEAATSEPAKPGPAK